MLTLILLVGSLQAQSSSSQSAPLDPSDIYFQAWLIIREAEKLEANKQPLKAHASYQRAQKLFKTISSYHPQWKPDLVKMRLNSTHKSIQNLTGNAQQQQKQETRNIQDLVSERSSSSNLPPSLTAPSLKTPLSSASSKELEALKNQAATLKSQLQRLTQSDQQKTQDLQTVKNELKQAQERIKQLRDQQSQPLNATPSEAFIRLQKRIVEVEKELFETRNDRDARAARNRRLLAQLKQQQEQLRENPFQEEMKSLNQKLQKMTQEKEALLLSLQQSNKKLKTAVLAANQIKQAHSQTFSEKKELEAHLSRERLTSNEVIQGLRTQLKEKQTLLDNQSRLLREAQQRNDSLSTQLTEANAVIADLEKERDLILKERDQMAHLLNLQKTDQIQRMVDQNMKLGRQLREAREALQTLSDDNNATKDQLIEAKYSLALAKDRIIKMRKERAEQEKNLARSKQELLLLKEQLAATPSDANETQNSDSSEEVKTLKDVIKRQLLAQEQRQQKTTLLLAELSRMRHDNPQFGDALVALSEAEFELSDDEEKLLFNKKIDQQFIAPNRASPAERKRAATNLQKNRTIMTGAAIRCFKGKRYHAAREIYEMILDLSPGHTPSLLNLGTVHLKLKQYQQSKQAFENALTLQGKDTLPFAHYMLGVIHYEQGEYDLAQEKLQYSLMLYEENPKAHIYLGNISGLDAPKEAKKHYQTAIDLDPSLSEPYYNLSYIEQKQGNLKKAAEYYQTLLEKGGAPDKTLEKKLRTLKQ